MSKSSWRWIVVDVEDQRGLEGTEDCRMIDGIVVDHTAWENPISIYLLEQALCAARGPERTGRSSKINTTPSIATSFILPRPPGTPKSTHKHSVGQ